MSDTEFLKTKSSTKSLKEFAISSCRICLSAILDPARLGCGHQFCERCLSSYWKATEEPTFVVCPLCRDNAFKIGFVEKIEVDSTWDFRKRFNPQAAENCTRVTKLTKSSPVSAPPSTVCLIISIMMLAVYFLVKYLVPHLMNIGLTVS